MTKTGGAACPFCGIDPGRILLETDLAMVIRDGFPLSPGHALVIPRRHVPSFFDLTGAERLAVLDALDKARTLLAGEFHPDGWNIGINDGPAAGQTVMHLHVHLIPRYEGDQPDPRGGVRLIFPDRARYWEKSKP